MLLLIIVLLVVSTLLLGLAILVYNKLVSHREGTRNAFAQIDVQLERRHDLIPNLVETAKGYLAHESETLEGVIAARASATQARINVNGDPTDLAAMQNLGASEGALGSALGRLLAVSEAYPELKANQTMNRLTEELTTTENRITFARQHYNDLVNNYQTYKQSFPPVLIAGGFKFRDAVYLDLDDDAAKRETIKVSFTETTSAD